MMGEHGTTTDPSARLRRPETYPAAPDRECDVVMKGGITSGVLYPLAACELATSFRFRNVGGTSAGAIAAAMVAAAEHGRGTGSDDDAKTGFPALAALPGWFSADGNLLKLFHPASETGGIFRLLIAVIRTRSGRLLGLRRVAAVVGRLFAAAMNRFFWLVIAAVLPGLVVLWSLGWDRRWSWAWGAGLALATVAVAATGPALRSAPAEPAAPCAPPPSPDPEATKRRRAARAAFAIAAVVLAGVVAAAAGRTDFAAAVAAGFGWLLLVGGILVGAAAAVFLGTARVLPKTMFGLVPGSGDSGEPLSDWLARTIDEVAGLGPGEGPLTFGHLWRGAGSDDPAAAPNVNLEMLTTCLTQGRPFRLPRDLNRNFFFDPAEFRKLFPESVVTYLTNYVHPERPKPGRWEALRDAAARQGLVPLPNPEDLPVIVATRMTLSFPILMSAVPLYTTDRSCPAAGGETVLERCWFSDGGITSNFPVSFFDSILPRRPTFGINLRKFHPAHPQSEDERKNSWMPRDNGSGILQWWQRIPEDAGLRSLTGFGGLILDTMQNWVDNQHLGIPGYRDRIVHISHNDKEGGMNLDMPTPTLDRLAERGRGAGATVVEYYTNPPGDDREVSWENHRWVRLRTALGLLGEQIEGLAAVFPDGYEADLMGAVGAAPSYQLENVRQRALALSLMRGMGDWVDDTGIGLGDVGLVDIGEKLTAATGADEFAALDRGAPRPRPDFRIVPGSGRT